MTLERFLSVFSFSVEAKKLLIREKGELYNLEEKGQVKIDLKRLVCILFIFQVNNILNNHNMSKPVGCNVGRPGWHPGIKGSGFNPRCDRNLFLSFVTLFQPLVSLSGV